MSINRRFEKQEFSLYSHVFKRFGSRGLSEISAVRLGYVTDNALIEKAWEDAVQGLGKGSTMTMSLISFFFRYSSLHWQPQQHLFPDPRGGG